MSVSNFKDDPRVDQILRPYFSANRILIVDRQSSVRARLAASLTDIGTPRHQMSLCATFEEARAALRSEKPKIVLCEYDLDGGRSGLDLVEDLQAAHAGAKDLLFIIVTGNNSQSAVARAAEEDVDGFVLKPYTAASLKQSVMISALAKLAPSDYMRAIERGEDHLALIELDQAQGCFEQAKAMDPRPTLACFYLGQVDLMRDALDPATGRFREGLSISKIHYKCLVGMFDTLQKLGRADDAYDVVKRVVQYFPANPKRLSAVLRLAIVTRNYGDIESYYRLFTLLEHREDELLRYICAALSVTGKHYLQTNVNSRALELFDKVAVSGAGRAGYLNYVIENLVEHGLHKEARVYLKRYAPEDEHHRRAMEYLISAQELPAVEIVERGRRLLADAVEHPVVFRVLIPSARESGLLEYADSLESASASRLKAGA